MSYSRWLRSDWYVFASSNGIEPVLEVWRAGGESLPCFTNREVREMVASGDLRRIAGYEDRYKEELLAHFRSYLRDEEVCEQAEKRHAESQRKHS
jgi:hypothetical protein